MNNKTRQKKGFTIVELVIVIAVIAILAAVLIPVFSGVVDRAKLSADQVAVRNMNTVLATGTVEDGKIDDPNEARGVLYEGGFNASNLVPTSSGHTFYWYMTDNVVILANASGVVVYPEAYEGDKIGDYATGTAINLAELPYAKIEELPTVTLSNDNIQSEGAPNGALTSLTSPITLDKALQFSAVHTLAEAEKLPYGGWYVDYVITINKKLNASGAKYYLAGQYNHHSTDWVLYNVTNYDAGQYQLLKSLIDVGFTYEDICLFVKTFNCGIAVEGTDSELEVTVQLVMYQSEGEWERNENAKVVNTYTHSFN